MPRRDPGLYWVRVYADDGWTIAEWDPVTVPQLPCWLLIASDEPCRAVVEVGARVDAAVECENHTCQMPGCQAPVTLFWPACHHAVCKQHEGERCGVCA